MVFYGFGLFRRPLWTIDVVDTPLSAFKFHELSAVLRLPVLYFFRRAGSSGPLVRTIIGWPGLVSTPVVSFVCPPF